MTTLSYQACFFIAVTSTLAFNSQAENDALTDLINPESSVSLGVSTTDGDREQWGIYDGVRDSENTLLFNADIVKRDDRGRWVKLNARDLGFDSRSLELSFERQGDWGVGLDYQQIPHSVPYSIESATVGLGNQTQTTPLSITPGTAANVELGTERERIGINFFKYLNPLLNLQVSFKNDNKSGERHWGYRAGSGGQVHFLAEPIDSNTRQMDAKLDYLGSQLQLTGGYYGSLYDTDSSLVTAISASGTDYLSSNLDNQAHQFYLNGGYNLTPTTRATFRASYTHATMDERLPTANILGLADASAPSSIDGEVNTSLLFLGLTARPIKNLSLVAKMRYHEVDDETPALLIVPSRSIHIKPNDYKTISAKLEGSYRLPDGYTLIAGLDQRNQERKGEAHIVPSRTDLDETTYSVKLRKSLSNSLNGSIGFSTSRRDGSNYEPAENPEENVLNPINIADRDRDKWQLSLDWVVSDKLGLQFNYEYSNDDYGPNANPNGLTEGSARLLALDADYLINDDWRLAAWLSLDKTKASERVTDYGANFATIEFERRSHLIDKGSSVGAQIDGQVNRKLKLGAKAEWTRSQSEFNDNNDPNISAPDTPLPDIKSTASKLALFAEYSLDKKADVRVDFIYQDWRTNDWAWEFSDGTDFSYTTTGGTRVIADPNQTATFLGVSYSYKF